MNDFSKNELKDLKGLVESYLMHVGMDDYPCDHINLKQKLTNLIELYDAKTIKVWHCEKCGHVQ